MNCYQMMHRLSYAEYVKQGIRVQFDICQRIDGGCNCGWANFVRAADAAN